MDGVQFFISCITMVQTNARRPKSDEEDEDDEPASRGPTIFPGVAYFVVFRETSKCTKETIFVTLHDADMEPTITEIKTRNNRGLTLVETAVYQIAQVVKDHNNAATKNMVIASNLFCRSVCRAREIEDEDEKINRRNTNAQIPCRLVVVQQDSYGGPLSEAHAALTSDGLECELEIISRPTQSNKVITAPSDITATIREIELVMMRCHHALHRGFLYGKPMEATLTYVKMMDVKTYVNKLLTNDALREKIIKNMSRIVQLLSHPGCEIISQIEFDPDYIEVSGGQFFQISTRSFTECPPRMPLGKISPRTYIPYDSTTPPQPLYFKNGIVNSFPDLAVRTAFLNKFYQCFVGRRMPQKIRKLVVSGPKDSGKTSWACVLHRIVPSERVASITSEKKFSASMINDSTELVVIDDWSSYTMQSDLAKTLLQGGWLVSVVKHEQPKCVWNNSPFYITTNTVPDFGKEMENVERRIAVYETQSLPRTTAGVDKWIYEHAMDCLVWTANEITANIDHVPRQERWYENTDGEASVIDDNNVAR